MCQHIAAGIGLLNVIIFAAGLFAAHVGGMFANRAKRFPRSVTPPALLLFIVGAAVCSASLTLPPMGVYTP